MRGRVSDRGDGERERVRGRVSDRGDREREGERKSE